jgi:PPOX class probable F420-dependent enzyme
VAAPALGSALDVGSRLGVAVEIGEASAGGDEAAVAGERDGVGLVVPRPAHAAPSTTAAIASAPSRIHHRLDIRPSVRAVAVEDPQGASGGHHGAMTLTHPERRFLGAQRRATLVTIAPDGRPRPVPICFVLVGAAAVLYTPLDDKPKATDDPLALARVRDITADTRVAILADRWDEDWTRLAWLRAEGRATLLEPGPEHATAVAALRATYPQYQTHRLDDRPLIRVEIDRVTTWGALEPD